MKIVGYSKKGHGLIGECEVVGAIAGDEVTIGRIEKGRKGKPRARLEEILTPSPNRVEARCSHFGVCGGCTWQQMSYEAELREKESLVQELFLPKPITPIVGLEDPWQYRGKMEFTFSQDKAGEYYLGLNIQCGRGKVLNLEECPISPSWMTKTLDDVRNWWKSRDLLAYFPPKDKGSLRTLTLRSSHDQTSRMAILTVSGNPEYALSRADIDSFVEAVSKGGEISVYLLIHMAVKGKETTIYEMHLKGPAYFEESLLDKTFRMGPRSFFQPNAKIAEKMFAKVIDILKLTGNEKVLDLYSGIGTIGMLLSGHVRQVIAVEENRAAVDDGKENIERLGLHNIQIYAEDAAKFLERIKDLFIPDIVIVDPPRTGLGAKSIELLLKYAPKKIVYVSCNPLTQKEDIEAMQGYQIEEVAPFDQFPHTPHVENIILLTRSDCLT